MFVLVLRNAQHDGGAPSSSAHRAPLAEPDSLATKNKSGNVPDDHCLARIQQRSDAVS
jgi:hypothetical protein